MGRILSRTNPTDSLYVNVDTGFYCAVGWYRISENWESKAGTWFEILSYIIHFITIIVGGWVREAFDRFVSIMGDKRNVHGFIDNNNWRKKVNKGTRNKIHQLPPEEFQDSKRRWGIGNRISSLLLDLGMSFKALEMLYRNFFFLCLLNGVGGKWKGWEQ